MKRVLATLLGILILATPAGSRASILGPEKIDRNADFEMNQSSFASAIVVDVESGRILYRYNDQKPWSGASLTKLMSSYIFLKHQPVWDRVVELRSEDEVGGGRLRVDDGAQLTMEDLFYSTITASANNTATAMPRVQGIASDVFLKQMNDTAKEFAMRQTNYVGFSGMDPENITSARDIAKLSWRTFGEDMTRRAMTVSNYSFTILNTGEKKTIKNTNHLLTEAEYGDLYVTGGKTGFLYESMYNLVVQVRPTADANADRTIIVVVLGSPNRDSSFNNAADLARWTWENFTWDSLN